MDNVKVAVIGSGLMGGGIAQACAQAGFTVVNIDIAQAPLDKAQALVAKLLQKSNGSVYHIRNLSTVFCRHDFFNIKMSDRTVLYPDLPPGIIDNIRIKPQKAVPDHDLLFSVSCRQKDIDLQHICKTLQILPDGIHII